MQRIKYFIVSGLMMGNFAFVPIAVAHEDVTTESPVTEETAQDPASRKARIEERKKQQNLKMDSIESQKIAARCASAQGKIKSVNNRGQTSGKRYTTAYHNLTDKLDIAIGKLAQTSLDITELKTQQTELQSKIEVFKANLDSYFQSLTDLETMDCEADPEGFKASIETARNTRKALQDEAKAIKTFIQQTIKPTLLALKDQLKATEGQDGTEQ